MTNLLAAGEYLMGSSKEAHFRPENKEHLPLFWVTEKKREENQ